MNIQEQIEALTQELRPYPEKVKLLGSKPPFHTTKSPFWFFDGKTVWGREFFGTPEDIQDWAFGIFASTNKAEVEEYADCYCRLKLYQLLGKKSMKSDPEAIEKKHLWTFYGTDFYRTLDDQGCIYSTPQYRKKLVLGGVWFAREEDRLEALRICGIDKAFQEKCAKYGLGGA